VEHVNFTPTDSSIFDNGYLNSVALVENTQPFPAITSDLGHISNIQGG